MTPKPNSRPPKDDICRAVAAQPTLQRAEGDSGDSGMPTLVGEFAKFNEWTEINSVFEGRFLERIDPKAFTKTFKEGRQGMRVLFQHGMDPQIGDKPLGPIKDLRATETGAAYEVPLLDTSYNRDLIPGLEQNLYGASFRFRVMREEVVDDPGASDYNPAGLPERTIKEAQVKEFGPVTFPAYEGATAGVRSLTDEYLFRKLQGADPERIEEMAEYWREERDAVSGSESPDVTDEPAAGADAPAAVAEGDEGAERGLEEDAGTEAPAAEDPDGGEPRSAECVADLAGALEDVATYAAEGNLTDADRAKVANIVQGLTELLSSEAQKPLDEANSSTPDSDSESRREQKDAVAPDARATPPRDYLSTEKERPAWML